VDIDIQQHIKERSTGTTRFIQHLPFENKNFAAPMFVQRGLRTIGYFIFPKINTEGTLHQDRKMKE
jgi:hypothetical protein